MWVVAGAPRVRRVRERPLPSIEVVGVGASLVGGGLGGRGAVAGVVEELDEFGGALPTEIEGGEAFGLGSIDEDGSSIVVDDGAFADVATLLFVGGMRHGVAPRRWWRSVRRWGRQAL